MNENVENLILVQLREMRTEMAGMRGEIADVKRDVASLRSEVRSEMADVNQKVDGLSLMMTMLMGHVAHLGDRVERLEEKVH